MKDPAVLIYDEKWIASTNGMKAVFRAWYMDLLMYQYRHEDGIPNDEDVIAGICRVVPSEFDLFKQMLEQVLRAKFKLTEKNCWKNSVATEILNSRSSFLEKRTKSGTIGYLTKLFFAQNLNKIYDFKRVKDYLMTLEIDELDKAKDKQVLEHLLEQNRELIIDINIDKDNTVITNGKVGNVGSTREGKKVERKKKQSIFLVGETVEEKKNSFKELLRPQIAVFGKEMIIDFGAYWCELTQDGKRLRVEDEKYFELERRLTTWKNNQSKFSAGRNFATPAEKPKEEMIGRVSKSDMEKFIKGEQ